MARINLSGGVQARGRNVLDSPSLISKPPHRLPGNREKCQLSGYWLPRSLASNRRCFPLGTSVSGL